MSRRYPKWATPDRQSHLVNLFIRSRGFCVFGHKNCLIPEHHYEIFIEDLITDWKEDDRQQRLAELREGKKRLHRLDQRSYPLHGRFSAVSSDIFHDNQPIFYPLGMGINALTFKPFAKVRLGSSYVNLYVDLGDTLKPLSKSKRRKAIRYGKGLNGDIESQIYKLCELAVRHYLGF